MLAISPDLLSATSLLIGAVGVLYAGAQREVGQALAIRPAPKRLDREPQLHRVGQVLRSRSVPLTMASWAVVVIFAPTAMAAVVAGVREVAVGPIDALRAYDPVPVAFFAVYVVAVFLALSATATMVRLARLHRRLDQPDQT
jgi:hypothetical protein